MPKPKEVITAVVTSDTLVHTGEVEVHWLSISNTHATETVTMELSNSADGTSNDLFQVAIKSVAENSPAQFYVFDPLIPFTTHLYIDLTSGTPIVTVGYTAD